jgi:hypothetical protein
MIRMACLGDAVRKVQRRSQIPWGQTTCAPTARRCRAKRWREECAEVWQQHRHVTDGTDGAEIWSEAVSERLYTKALREGAAIANRSVSAKFEDGRRKTWGEYVEFLGRVGRGLGVDNASDLDVIAFVQGVWLPTHVEK